MQEEMETLIPPVGVIHELPLPGGPTGATEIRRSKRLRGTISFTGDAYSSMLAVGIAALGEEATRLENLPNAPWFMDYRLTLESLGVLFQQIDEHWLVRGGALHPPSEPLEPLHELAALILAGIGSGLGLDFRLNLDSVNISSDVRSLLNLMYPAGVRGELHRKARNFCKPFELGWDDSFAKIPLLFHHLAAGEGLELQLRRPGSDLLENLLRQFEIDIKVERDDDKGADELTRRMARRREEAQLEPVIDANTLLDDVTGGRILELHLHERPPVTLGYLGKIMHHVELVVVLHRNAPA